MMAWRIGGKNNPPHSRLAGAIADAQFSLPIMIMMGTLLAGTVHCNLAGKTQMAIFLFF